jgi:hypothetical protein
MDRSNKEFAVWRAHFRQDMEALSDFRCTTRFGFEQYFHLQVGRQDSVSKTGHPYAMGAKICESD